jgi:ribonuclease P protein component
MRLSLKKKEILRSKILIDQLFSEGKKTSVESFRLIYLLSDNEENKDANFQFIFSVPKKNIKLAVNRNKIKRRTKEVIRLNKQAYIERLNNKKLYLAVIFTEKEIKSFQEIEKSIKIGLDKVFLSLEILPNSNQ